MITAMRPRDRVSDDVGLSDAATPAVPDRPVSLSALRLHAQGLLASFEGGHPGRVFDRYLDSLGEVASGVLELCLSGVWARVDDGYQVVSSEALRMAHEVLRQVRPSRTQADEVD